MTDGNLKKQSIKLFLLLLVPVLGGSIGYYFIFGSQYSFIDYLYMTVITISTVGYTEIVDTTGHPAARLFTIFILVLGMGTMMFAVSTFTAFIVEGTFQNIWRRKKMEQAIQNLNNHYVVCGYGETGHTIVQELYRTKRDFVIVEQSKEVIKELEEFNQERDNPMLYIEGDASDEDTLLKAGLERAVGLITALREDKDNLFVTITARGLNNKMRIVVRAANLSHKRKFFRAGADSVVSPNFIGGMRLVSEMIRPHVVTFLDTMLRQTESVIRVEEHTLPDNSKLVGLSLKDAHVQQKTGCLVMALKKYGDRKFNYIPDPTIRLEPGMTLVVLGEVENILKLRQC